MVYNNNTTTNDTLQVYTTTPGNLAISPNNDLKDNNTMWTAIAIVCVIAIIIAVAVGMTKDKYKDEDKK